MAEVASGETGDKGSASVRMWLAEMEKAERRMAKFVTRGEKIIKRYRDDRIDAAEGAKTGRKRFNLLWSNVQTMLPALYAKRPEPIVERRFLDHDPIGRIASTMLERDLRYEIEDNGYHESVGHAVLDYLLPGMGQVWIRYEPIYGSAAISPEDRGGSPYDDEAEAAEGKSEYAEISAEGAGAPPGGYPVDTGGGVGAGDPEAGEQAADPAAAIADERVPVDYVNWNDFLYSQARTWAEVTWVARRIYMGRNELVARFGKIGKKVPLERPRDASGRFLKTGDGEDMTKGEVYEIWCKETHKVKFIAKGYSDEFLDHVDDPLRLEGFWPCPRPLFSTMTNDQTIPVPDFAEYQDQADELDSLTNRISSLTRSLKVAGVYDASAIGLQRVLDEGVENKLIPINNWAAFAEKGGIDGAVSWVPIKDVAAVLLNLTQIFEWQLQRCDQITGISDIVRGQGEGGQPKTATEQNIKGSFASQRLQWRQAEVARFARDVLRIVAEIIAEHWAPQTIIMKSSIMEDDGLTEDGPATGPPQPGMGHNGGPPLELAASGPGGLGAAAPGMAMGGPEGIPPPGMGGPMPPPDPQAAKLAQIAAALELLRNDKLRGFRIDIETDSTISMDSQQEKEQTIEFTTAMSAFMEKAFMAVQAFPPSLPLIAKMGQTMMRRFRAGRDIEAAFDQFISDANRMIQQAAAAPPKPDPEQMKAQAEMAKAQADMAADQQKQAMEAARSQMDIRAEQQRLEIEAIVGMAEARAKAREIELKMELAEQEHVQRMTEMAFQQEVDREMAAIKKTQAKQNGGPRVS